MPYNILHIVSYMHPSTGGPPVVVENFVAEARRLGHSSEILSTTKYCRDDEHSLKARLDELAPTTLLTELQTLPFVSRSASAVIDAHVRRADLVHVHTLWRPLNIAARYACLRHDRPYVVMPHGMLDPYSLSVKALKKSLYLRLFESRNMARAQRMIYTTSEEERLAALAGLRLPPGKIVPLGARTSSTSTGDLRLRFLLRYIKPKARGGCCFSGDFITRRVLIVS